MGANSFPNNLFVDILEIQSNSKLEEIQGNFMPDDSQYETIIELGIFENENLR